MADDPLWPMSLAPDWLLLLVPTPELLDLVEELELPVELPMPEPELPIFELPIELPVLELPMEAWTPSCCSV